MHDINPFFDFFIDCFFKLEKSNGLLCDHTQREDQTTPAESVNLSKVVAGLFVAMSLLSIRRWLFSVLLAGVLILAPAAPAHALGGEQIPLGDPAPDFTLPTNIGDGDIALSDYLGQWVVLYFYPKDFTPGCTLEAQRFQRDLPEYIERNTQVIGVSADDVDSHAEFCDSEGLRFPLLADADGAVSRAYGSWMRPMSMRHTYLIGPEGTMRERFLGVRPAIHSQEVLARLDELQQA